MCKIYLLPKLSVVSVGSGGSVEPKRPRGTDHHSSEDNSDYATSFDYSQVVKGQGEAGSELEHRGRSSVAVRSFVFNPWCMCKR